MWMTIRDGTRVWCVLVVLCVIIYEDGFVDFVFQIASIISKIDVSLEQSLVHGWNHLVDFVNSDRSYFDPCGSCLLVENNDNCKLGWVEHWTTIMSNTSAGTSSKPRASSSQPSETSSKRKRGVFQKELQHMMYGFGDDPNPLPESVALMEDIVVEYVTELVHKAQDIGSQRGKLSVEDFLYLIRKDLPKLNRCSELLSMNEELKQARKVFESDEEKLRKVFEVDETAEG
ncbi:hypothetical protein VNO77_13935 [Canavalia gladiata]|uniref:Transcription initiation factor TFIID subunit 13 n=1 Tax=Canavalia gladiata TaxID=3824 RepID=A0AAN9M2Y5_CANGL